MPKPKIIFKPTPGSQELFLTCPVWECLLHGDRGGGKTLSLIMDFLRDVGKGHGRDWNGILFRKSYTQLTDIISQCHQWIPQIFPDAHYNKSEYKWTFKTGEELLLRYISTPEDYWAYHGWSRSWVGFEELTTWPTLECYLKMMSINRSSNPNVPLRYRATTNPSGPGHQAVKRRFIDVADPGQIYTESTGQERVHIPCSLNENFHLLEANPLYKDQLIMLTKDNPNLRKAWIEGSWDLVSDGSLSDLWDYSIHVRRPFPFPSSWKVYRAHDWGSAKPWAVGYGAEANGEQPDSKYGMPFIPAGSVIIIDELYGWTGMPNEGDRALSPTIASKTLTKDKQLCIEYKLPKIYIGPADTSIWDVKDGKSIAGEMGKCGLFWTRAYKGSGSRIAGLTLIRQMLGASLHQDLERPHLYFFSTARNHVRTLPELQPDPKKPEDVNSSQEDHCYDELRYLLSRKMTAMHRGKVKN